MSCLVVFLWWCVFVWWGVWGGFFVEWGGVCIFWVTGWRCFPYGDDGTECRNVSPRRAAYTLRLGCNSEKRRPFIRLLKWRMLLAVIPTRFEANTTHKRSFAS